MGYLTYSAVYGIKFSGRATNRLDQAGSPFALNDPVAAEAKCWEQGYHDQPAACAPDETGDHRDPQK